MCGSSLWVCRSLSLQLHRENRWKQKHQRNINTGQNNLTALHENVGYICLHLNTLFYSDWLLQLKFGKAETLSYTLRTVSGYLLRCWRHVIVSIRTSSLEKDTPVCVIVLRKRHKKQWNHESPGFQRLHSSFRHSQERLSRYVTFALSPPPLPHFLLLLFLLLLQISSSLSSLFISHSPTLFLLCPTLAVAAAVVVVVLLLLLIFLLLLLLLQRFTIKTTGSLKKKSSYFHVL